MKDSLFIHDLVFKHAKTSSWDNESSIFQWDRENPDLYEAVVTTDLSTIESLTHKKKYGWIIEPRIIDLEPYKIFEEKKDKFDKIFTFDKKLIESSNKFEFIPAAGCWIKETDRKIHEKRKLLSTIVSFKKQTMGHNFRHKIIEKIKGIDVYGNGYYFIEEKIIALKDYMFCIVVENQKIDYYFTEKIIDCFMTGTIPIYYGCPSISRFFDNEGIICFDNLVELSDIIKNLTPEIYENKKNSIIKNFELSKKYLIPDELIYEKIKNKN